MTYLVFWCALLIPAQEANEAEKLFHGAEKKLLDAESLQVSVKTTVTFGKAMKLEAKGQVFFAKGNKSWIDYEELNPARKFQLTAVSDGEKMRVLKAPFLQQALTQDIPKNYHQNFVGFISRTGFFPGITETRTSGKASDPISISFTPDLPKVSDFAMQKPENVGDKKAIVLTYKYDMHGAEGEKMVCRLWLDADSKLPLKRVYSYPGDPRITAIEEAYEIRINAAIDKKKFVLPN